MWELKLKRLWPDVEVERGGRWEMEQEKVRREVWDMLRLSNMEGSDWLFWSLFWFYYNILIHWSTSLT